MLDHSSMMFPETAHFSGRVVHVASSRRHDRTRSNRRSRLTLMTVQRSCFTFQFKERRHSNADTQIH